MSKDSALPDNEGVEETEMSTSSKSSSPEASEVYAEVDKTKIKKIAQEKQVKHTHIE